MNTVQIPPEVLEFAAGVRAQLADLTPDEREELTGGLEADLSDLVAERGVEVLGDPVEYAVELRAAAGLPTNVRAGVRTPLAHRVTRLLDAAGDRWRRAVTGLPGGPWELVASLRPVWWLLRAYVAVQCLDLVWGDGGYNMSWLPSLRGWGVPLVLVAAVASVQIGRGRLWPGRRDGVADRLVLLVLNTLALVMVGPVFGSLPDRHGHGPIVWERSEGLVNNGEPVRNIFPYDAQGRPLVGVQLFDERGDALKAETREESVSRDDVVWTYPWTSVDGQVWNAYPLPVAPVDSSSGWRRMPSPWTSATPPELPSPPLDGVPEVTSPAADRPVPDRVAGRPARKGE